MCRIISIHIHVCVNVCVCVSLAPSPSGPQFSQLRDTVFSAARFASGRKLSAADRSLQAMTVRRVESPGFPDLDQLDQHSNLGCLRGSNLQYVPSGKLT